MLSLCEQTLTDIEIILVDDGSPDSCPSLCDSFAKEDDRIKVIHKLNGGLSSARNAGVAISRGEYCMFVDSDDWLELDACETFIRVAEEEKSDIVACGYIKEFKSHASISQLWNHEFTTRTENVLRRLFGPIGEELRRPQDLDLPVSACMQIIKSECAKEVEFVDTNIIGTEDLLYQVMTYTKLDWYTYISKPMYHYRRSDYGTLTTKYMAEKFDRWQCLYDRLFEIASQYDDSYTKALNNRVAFSLIGLGLNEILSGKSKRDISRRLKAFIETERYQNALSQLDISFLPIHWKLFFTLCKREYTYPLTWLLFLMEYLRKRLK